MRRFLSFFFLLILCTSFVLSIDADINAKKGLLILGITASLWISEIIPLSITGLLVPVLGVVLGIVDVKRALLPFAHPVIFLFFGGFVLATALSKYEIDRFVAYKIAKISENPPDRNYTFLLLGIAYSASVGGMGTLVGSPPNGIAAGLLNLSFADWISFGLPLYL